MDACSVTHKVGENRSRQKKKKALSGLLSGFVQSKAYMMREVAGTQRSTPRVQELSLSAGAL